MYYVNINPDLLGKNKFEVSKTINTIKLFKDNLQQIINEIVAFNPSLDYNDLFADIENLDDITTGLSSFITEAYEVPLNIPKKLQNLVKIFKGDYEINGGVSLTDIDYATDLWESYYDDNFTYNIIDNFPYILVYSSIGDDALAIVANIIYFDNNENLTIYTPIYGNTYIPDINVAFGAYSNSMKIENFFEKLVDDMKVPKEIKTFAGEDVSGYETSAIREFLAYDKLHGIKTIEDDDFYSEPWGHWVSCIVVDKNRIKEDILSNIK